MKQVLMAWQISNRFGWGIAGLNIFLHWARSKEINPFSIFPIRPEDISGIDPLRYQLIAQKIEQSNQISAHLGKLLKEGKQIKIEGAVIHALGNRFEGAIPNLSGDVNIARVVFENTNVKDHVKKLDRYDKLVCVSNWNANLLSKLLPKKEIVVTNEAVDTSIFCPGPKSGIFDNSKFYIFSGGKVEYRKAQDLVLLAFREFSKKHDDAVLVTSWHSPWVQLSAGFKGKLDAALTADTNGRLNIRKWVEDNGIDPNKVIDIGTVPNEAMPMVLREMDCALQPSRAEAGTNFVVKEAMACGVPVIAAANTGMLDLLDETNCLIVKSTKKVEPPRADFGVQGWTEPQVGSITQALEDLRGNKKLRDTISKSAIRATAKRSWLNHAIKLAESAL